MRARASIWILTLGLAGVQAVCAQVLSDPTRPPAAFQSVGQLPAGPDRGGLVLQSVLISPGSRSAIISGEHVMLGEKFRGVRLVRVAETEVVLLGGGTSRTLKLFPGVEKRPAGSTREIGLPETPRDTRTSAHRTLRLRRPR